MRNYQRTRNNPYKLPHCVYMQMVYLVRDYDRMKAQREEILHASPPCDGIPSHHIGSPTESKGIRLAALDDRCAAVERALQAVPLEYRMGVWANVCYGARYPCDADPETYGRHRRRFLYQLAKNQNFL